MPTESAPRPLARQLLRVVLGPGEATDRELLARFVRSRDEDAFAELVRRHGRMVLAVARRVTGHPQDAEDAFQAAFLVLARRAAQLDRPEQLANWLYGVAYRTALEARAARRRVLEHSVTTAPEPAAPPPPDDGADLRRVIDEELAKLPDKYRAAVVLCDLEGLPRAEAAARLRIPEGTLSSRLAYARKVLAGRLTRRGITSSAGAIAVVLSREAIGSTVPRDLVQLTARAAAKVASGGAVPPDLVSPSVSSLTDGVMKTMLAYRLRLMLGLVLASGLVGLGAYGLAQAPPGQNPLPQPEVIRVRPGQNVYEPLAGFPGEQPKPEKVVPKGIEDDDVPYPSTPTQAVVRVEDGKVIVRQRTSRIVSVAPQNVPGQPVVAWQRKSDVQATTHDPADVAVFDMKGNRLQPKVWKEKLKNDVHALVTFDGRLPNPRELTLFKDDTLIVVLPTGTTTAVWGVTDVPLPPPATVPAQPFRPGSVAPPASFPGTPSAPPFRPVTPRSGSSVAPPDDVPPQNLPTNPGS
jgi:RNA polymerase sigma factor (sigma-70 family)